jgi:TM2 domain-containing membrane protein YozV
MKKFLYIFFILLVLFKSSAYAADTLYYEPEPMKSPGIAMGLSLILPGAGQAYNNKWGKGLIFFGAQSALAGTAAYYYYSYFTFKDLYGENAALTQQALTYAKRVTWFSAAVYVYALIDSYVDAHLSAFPNERLILEPNPKMNGLQLTYHF